MPIKNFFTIETINSVLMQKIHSKVLREEGGELRLRGGNIA
jgi:hypothetical protein